MWPKGLAVVLVEFYTAGPSPCVPVASTVGDFRSPSEAWAGAMANPEWGVLLYQNYNKALCFTCLVLVSAAEAEF